MKSIVLAGVALLLHAAHAADRSSAITDMDTQAPYTRDRIMEVGTVYITAGVWTTVTTAYDSFANGKVFVSVIQSDTADILNIPVAPRIDNVRSSGRASFDVSLFLPSGEKCPDYSTPAFNDTLSAVLSWMVVEQGGFTLDEGRVQLVIDSAYVSGVPTRVYWSHSFGSYCSATGGVEDVSEPSGFFTIESVNDPTQDMFMVPRVSDWSRVDGKCDFSWRQANLWVQGHSQLPRSTESHEAVNYFLFSNPTTSGYAIRCINDAYTLNFAPSVPVSSVLGAPTVFPSPSYFSAEPGFAKEPDDFFLPRVFGSVMSSSDGDSFVVYGLESTVLQSLLFLQEDTCQQHDTGHPLEQMSLMLIGRDEASLDAFGNTVSCAEHAYAVHYYGMAAEEDLGTSTAAILAAFFVSFSIVLCFTCGIAAPRLCAYWRGGNYAKSDSDGSWGVPNGRPTPAYADDQDDGSIDRSNTPFTHSTHQAVAGSRAV